MSSVSGEESSHAIRTGVEYPSKSGKPAPERSESLSKIPPKKPWIAGNSKHNSKQRLHQKASKSFGRHRSEQLIKEKTKKWQEYQLTPLTKRLERIDLADRPDGTVESRGTSADQSSTITKGNTDTNEHWFLWSPNDCVPKIKDRRDDPFASDHPEESDFDDLPSPTPSSEEESDFSDHEHANTTYPNISGSHIIEERSVRLLFRWIHVIIDRYIARLQNTLNLESFNSYTSHGNNETSGHSNTQESLTLDAPRQSESHGENNLKGKARKRSRQDDDDLPNDENPGSNQPALPPVPSVQKRLKPLLACFFHKHDPLKYRKENDMSYKSCCVGFRGIHRLKEHCNRNRLHLAPIHCTRCMQEFSSDEDMEAHRDREESQCPAKNDKYIDGITDKHKKEFENKLKGKKSDVEKWKIMYEIIFPGESAPSPFNGINEDIANFLESYPENNLPQLLETMQEAGIEPLKSCLKIIIHDILAKLDAIVRNHIVVPSQGGANLSNATNFVVPARKDEDDGQDQVSLLNLDSRSSNHGSTIYMGSPKTPLQEPDILLPLKSVGGPLDSTKSTTDGSCNMTSDSLRSFPALKRARCENEQDMKPEERSGFLFAQGIDPNSSTVEYFGSPMYSEGGLYSDGVTYLNKDFETWFNSMDAAGEFDLGGELESLDTRQ